MLGNPRQPVPSRVRVAWRVSTCLAIVFSIAVPLGAADKEYSVRGMILRVDRANRTFVVSHEKIAGLMDSMTMPFDVRDERDLDGIVPGAIVEFTLVVGERSAYATRMQVTRYEGVAAPRDDRERPIDE